MIEIIVVCGCVSHIVFRVYSSGSSCHEQNQKYNTKSLWVFFKIMEQFVMSLRSESVVKSAFNEQYLKWACN